jgi:hypothetical protein
MIGFAIEHSNSQCNNIQTWGTQPFWNAQNCGPRARAFEAIKQRCAVSAGDKLAE